MLADNVSSDVETFDPSVCMLLSMIAYLCMFEVFLYVYEVW